MSNSFQLNQYSVLTAVAPEGRTVYIKIVDTVCFLCYEGNVDAKELRLNLEIADVHTLINKCFGSEPDGDYTVQLGVNSGTLRLQFAAVVGGFLHIKFEVLLREKLMSNDGQLTFNFTKREQALAATNALLEKRCNVLAKDNAALLERLGQMLVPIVLQWNQSFGHFIGESSFYPANETKLELTCQNPQTGHNGMRVLFKNLVSFYQLKTVKITGHLTDPDFKLMQNSTLEELWLQLDGQSNNLTSLQGIQQRLPNLRQLTIYSAPALKDIPTVLRAAPHKIKKICIKSCSAVNTVEMQTFCQTSGISLEIA